MGFLQYLLLQACSNTRISCQYSVVGSQIRKLKMADWFTSLVYFSVLSMRRRMHWIVPSWIKTSTAAVP